MLPTILINLIFMMINVIYSKLKIITSVIPLGGMFPLSLIDSAMTAVPIIMEFIMCGPSIIQDMIIGIVKKKIAEMQACAIPPIPSKEAIAAAAA